MQIGRNLASTNFGRHCRHDIEVGCNMRLSRRGLHARANADQHAVQTLEVVLDLTSSRALRLADGVRLRGTSSDEGSGIERRRSGL